MSQNKITIQDWISLCIYVITCISLISMLVLYYVLFSMNGDKKKTKQCRPDTIIVISLLISILYTIISCCNHVLFNVFFDVAMDNISCFGSCLSMYIDLYFLQ